MQTPSSSLYSYLFIFIHFCIHCIRLSRHFHSSTIFITFTHLESQFYSLIASVAFNIIVTSAHLHRHSTHRHCHFHCSSFLPFTFIVTSTPIEHARAVIVIVGGGGIFFSPPPPPPLFFFSFFFLFSPFSFFFDLLFYLFVQSMTRLTVTESGIKDLLMLYK